jgi:hypothetical protein
VKLSIAKCLELLITALGRQVFDRLAGDLGEVIAERLPLFLVFAGIFYRDVGEDELWRVDELGRLGRGVGDHVAVGIGELLGQLIGHPGDPCRSCA